MKVFDIKIGDKLNVLSDIQNYLDDFDKLDHEEMVIIGVDEDCKFTLAEFITRYSEEDKAQFDVNYMFERIKETGTKGFILIHNHPSGVCIPTEIDVETTKFIVKEAKKNKLMFIEHYTWTNGLMWPIIKTSIGKGLYIKKEDISVK